jgi:hypothetical protein
MKAGKSGKTETSATPTKGIRSGAEKMQPSPAFRRTKSSLNSSQLPQRRSLALLNDPSKPAPDNYCSKNVLKSRTFSSTTLSARPRSPSVSVPSHPTCDVDDLLEQKIRSVHSKHKGLDADEINFIGEDLDGSTFGMERAGEVVWMSEMDEGEAEFEEQDLKFEPLILEEVQVQPLPSERQRRSPSISHLENFRSPLRRGSQDDPKRSSLSPSSPENPRISRGDMAIESMVRKIEDRHRQSREVSGDGSIDLDRVSDRFGTFYFSVCSKTN